MKGVTVFLKEGNNGKIKLTLNDVIATSDSAAPDWKHDLNFTQNEYDSESMKKLELTEKQYAEIGENLIIRLLALNGHLS